MVQVGTQSSCIVNAWVLASCYSTGVEGIGTKFAMGDETMCFLHANQGPIS